MSRLADVGAVVKQGDTLATLDAQDYHNRLRSAEADVAAAEAALVEARGTEGRLAKLLKDGWTPQANYDAAQRDLRSAEAKLAATKASREEIERAAIGEGMRTLWDDGLAKVAAGLTSIEELARVSI